MTTDRYQLIKPPDLENYGNIANDIAGVSWPEFMLHDTIPDEYWHELFDRFEEYQFALMDQESNRMRAFTSNQMFGCNTCSTSTKFVTNPLNTS